MVHWIIFGYIVHLASAATSYHNGAGVLEYVNPKIGTYGITPNGNGGMIPSVSPPFGMTRWTPLTRENFISQCPYNELDAHIHGFQATHQPAIWMGESGQVVLNPGIGGVQPLFEKRAHRFDKAKERSTAYVYEVEIDSATTNAGYNLTESIYSPVPGGAGQVPSAVSEGANGRVRRSEIYERPLQAEAEIRADDTVDSSTIKIALTATSHVGFLRVDFPESAKRSKEDAPYVFVQATRKNWTGQIDISPDRQEVSGSNPQRQDYALGPSRAPGFRGYFVSRFSEPFVQYGISHAGNITENVRAGHGEWLGGYVKFGFGVKRIEIRTGVSFVSIEQARRNLDLEIPDSSTFESIVERLKRAWLEKLGRVKIRGVNRTSAEYDPRTIWYTGLFHALQYPSDFSEPLDLTGQNKVFYSGYTDSAHRTNESYYQSWSIWDTYRAEHSLLTLFAPERVNNMMRSLLRIYDWAGRLPMWANVVETNIMIGTHVDAVLANALTRGFCSFDIGKAWRAVKKNAFEPPINDTELLYFDRESYTPDEVRAGLTKYKILGYVPNDMWSESASRTLDYAFDDFAAAVVATYAGDNSTAADLFSRSSNYNKIYNANTTFMEARNANGSWGGSEQGLTEGDDWVYTFNVMHDINGLAELLGGRAAMKAKLDQHFEQGHNDHTNEPSHHVPYLYAAIGFPAWTQNLTRAIAFENYNATAAGLSGNEDLGQMSAWYFFSALGFYPVNPASDKYIVGSPFFEHVSIRLPSGVASGGSTNDEEHILTIRAPNASKWPFVKSLRVDGKVVSKPEFSHGQIVNARRIEFQMAATPQSWGREGL